MENITYNITNIDYTQFTAVKTYDCGYIRGELISKIGGIIPYLVMAMGGIIMIMLIKKSYNIVYNIRFNKQMPTNTEIIDYIGLTIIWIMTCYMIFAYKIF